MHTQADIAISDDGKTATLQQENKQIKAILLDTSDDFRFTVSNAERLSTSPDPTPGELGAKGYSRLAIKIEDPTEIHLTVALVPQGSTTIPDTQPLSSWTTPVS